jgi:hypothetical protein
MKLALSNVATTLALLMVSLLSACFPAVIQPFSYPPEAQRLLALGERPLAVSIHGLAPDRTLGNQFLAVAFPVTRVYAPNIEREIEMHLALEAAARHYKLIPAQSDSHQVGPLLTVNVTELGLSGYDLIFIRRPSATLDVIATLDLPHQPPRSCSTNVEVTKTRNFAFNSQLSDVLRTALEQTSRDLFNCLGL